ncbi:hypothetical protein ISN39_32160 (plasmid) [Rhizobium sp. 007]|nr:hypothetical protein ISN39_32160 [Rhizobium sp. 007]
MRPADEALHVDLHGLFGETVFQCRSTFDELGTVEFTDTVAVDDGQAEALGDALCLRAVRAG